MAVSDAYNAKRLAETRSSLGITKSNTFSSVSSSLPAPSPIVSNSAVQRQIAQTSLRKRGGTLSYSGNTSDYSGTSETVQNQIERLRQSSKIKHNAKLQPAKIRASIAAERAEGRVASTNQGTTSGGSIASPLTEQDNTREYYATPSMVITSVNGFFTMELYPVKKVISKDANSQRVEQIYSETP